MQVNRVFNHRTYGRIGAVELTVDKGKWTLDGKELPERSIEYLMNFALQSLQDAYAGADSLTDAQAAFEKKRDAIIAGTIGLRSASTSEEPHMPFVRAIIRKALGDANKAKYEAIPSDDQTARKEFLNSLFEGLDEEKRAKVEAIAKQQYEADLAAKRAAKAAAATITL